MFFFLMIPRHPRSTLFPYTTLFRSSRFRREVMYKTAMFSGPRFQAIHSIETWGEDGQIGTLRSLSTNDLFRSVPEPHLIAAPVLLDAAGQTIAHWNGEDDAAGFRLFPYYVDEVR